MLLLLSSLSHESEGHVDVFNCHLVENPSLLLLYSKSLMYQILKRQVYSNSKQIFISLIGLVVLFSLVYWEKDALSNCSLSVFLDICVLYEVLTVFRYYILASNRPLM